MCVRTFDLYIFRLLLTLQLDISINKQYETLLCGYLLRITIYILRGVYVCVQGM